jgi:ATP-dependent DNA helicase RecG
MVSALEDLRDLSVLPVREVDWLVAAGYVTALQVLEHLPKRYEDRRQFDAFPSQVTGQPICLRGTVIDTSLRHFGPSRRFYEAVILDGTGGVFGSGKVTCRWFNMPYIQKLVAVGQDAVLYGMVKEQNGRLIIDHPEFEVVHEEAGGPSLHIERIVPIYRNISGIAQRRLREIIQLFLTQVAPETMTAAFAFDPVLSRAEMLRAVHFPESLAEAELMRRGFAGEEFFALQLNVVWRKARHQARDGQSLGKRVALLKRFYESLPFDLTEAQKRSVKEIAADMRTTRPMNRLLQGDVGSGKTFVAMAAMALALDSGVQASLMAPTQILAEQHYLTFCRWLSPLGVRISLRTSNREQNNFSVGECEPQIIIGTHALLYESVVFVNLGLIVIDEQHKFGVSQRAMLIRQGVMPDVLVMTATPIPRTLTMTIYGDLEVSVLDEKPPGRGKIITALRVGAKQTDVTKFVKAELSKGRQAYLVYPLVEESEVLKVESATAGFTKWQKRLSKFNVGLIHGKLKPEQKEAVMQQFRAGEIAALVATTVIEVGVDVPNANVMILHHAERFGLAQLHQLRGRIGRGENKSYCVLLTDGKSPEALEKLKVLEKTADGFEIAEADLRLRGPGDVLGKIQSGLSNLRFSDYLSDLGLLREARALAERVLREDPLLTEAHRTLRALIQDPNEVSDLPSTA